MLFFAKLACFVIYRAAGDNFLLKKREKNGGM